MTGGLAIALFVIGVVAAIMIHEFGHFWTARRFGMRADEFFLGFGPTVWSTRRGETRYGVKALPLGGYVRIRGMSAADTRRGPVHDDVFDHEAVAADRRRDAATTGVDVLSAPAVTSGVWSRLDDELDRRGTPAAVRGRILERARAAAGPHATVPEARAATRDAVEAEVEDTGRVGDLRHRLLRGDEGRFFPERPAWQRAIVLFAGAGTHFVVAGALLFAGYLLFPMDRAVAVVDEVLDDTPAQAAGLRPGDRIVSFAGVESGDDFQALREAIQARPGEPAPLVFERGGETITRQVVPAPETGPNGERVGRLGFAPSVESFRLTPLEAVEEALWGEASVTALTAQTVDALGRVFGPEGLGSIATALSGGERDVDGAVSLVGAASVTGQAVEQSGAFLLLAMLAAVNVFVGVFNLVPLPPLDGGHLAVLGVERAVNGVRRLRGRPTDFSVDERTVVAIALPVILIVGTVSVALLWLDITNPISLN